MDSEVIRDRFWIWGHDVGSHDNQFGLEKTSRMTPAEGALYLNVPNLILVRYNNLPVLPFEQYALAFRPLKQVVWSIVGAGGATDNRELEDACKLANRFPNFSGVVMDDFFRYDSASGRVAVHTADELKAIQDQLTVADRKLDLWVFFTIISLNIRWWNI